MDRILGLIKKLIPHKLFVKLQPFYHLSLAKIGAAFYGHPSKKMVIIGVTGTAGKSSTSYFIAQILEAAGFKVGMVSTTLFKIGNKEWLNDKRMTMLARFQTQKLLRQMLNANCQVAIVETTSEGIKQFRHIGIHYDIAVFTNLYPEHIEAHGGFENYKAAKGALFKYLSKTVNNKQLTINNKKINKTIIVNLDDEQAKYFLSFEADKKIGYSVKGNKDEKVETIILNTSYKIHLLGDYSQYNVLAAVTTAQIFNVPQEKIKKTVANLKTLPGRLEFIKNDLGIKIMVDYAFEPKMMEKLYKIVKNIEYNKIIHVFGSAGGGRDKSRRPVMGKIVAKNADVVIVTNEDAYDEDPMEIINQIASGANSSSTFQGEVSGGVNKNLFKIVDRRQAIKKGLELAHKHDLVLITGKGAEQLMCLKNGKKIPWDDRKVVKEEINKMKI